jgi:hypothetical protein
VYPHQPFFVDRLFPSLRQRFDFLLRVSRDKRWLDPPSQNIWLRIPLEPRASTKLPLHNHSALLPIDYHRSF